MEILIFINVVGEEILIFEVEYLHKLQNLQFR